MIDRLCVRDLELSTRIGVEKKERETPQRLLVSFSLLCDLSNVAKNDDVPEEFDYASLTESIRELGLQEHKTIERLAEDIASLLLRRSAARSVEVTVKKFPPLGVKEVSVTIDRPTVH